MSEVTLGIHTIPTALFTPLGHFRHALGPPNKTFIVSVSATMSRPYERDNKVLRSGLLTNTFAFTFYTDSPQSLPRVYPRTYGEAMQLIESHRRYQLGKALAEKRKAEPVKVRFELG